MSDDSKDPTDLEQLKLLFDYTKFHIGLYTAILGGATALLSIGLPKEIPLERGAAVALLAAIVCYAIAGFAGGVIAGNAPLFKGMSDFKAQKIGPFRKKCMGLFFWTGLEHTAFWVGTLFLLLFAFLYRLSSPKSCT